MTSACPETSFGDLLERVGRRITVQDGEVYSCIGVRWYGGGTFVREERAGYEIKRKQQWLVKAGDVIYNKLFAWKGAFAVANAGADECVASDKFPTYRADESRVRLDYLRFWFMTDGLARQARRLSKGAAAVSKLTLNPGDFWSLCIPLPSLAAQDVVLTKLQQVAKAIEGIVALRAPVDAVLQGRRAAVGSEVRLLMSTALRYMNESLSDRLGILDDALVMRPRSGPSYPCPEDGTGTAVVMPSALGGYRYDASKLLRGDGTEQLKEKDILQRGDMLIARGNKRDQVGLCIVYDSDEPRTYANLLMRMQVDRSRWLPEFVKYWIMSPLAVAYIRRHTKGTSPSVQKINQRSLVNMPFPAQVPLDLQRRWVDYLDTVFDGVEQCEQMIQEQYADVMSLRPTVLAAAFAGDL